MRSLLVHPRRTLLRPLRAIGIVNDLLHRDAPPAPAALILLWVFGLVAGAPAAAQTDSDAARFTDAAAVLTDLTADELTGIPADLLRRAHGIAVIPRVIRGGFLLGARRGRGVLTVRTSDGRFGNPVFVRLTGGSIGGQIGVESADLVLVFANERSVRNIASGKFTLGSDVSTVAGPTGRHTATALTGRAEVYVYIRSRGLFAGASIEGARLGVDEQGTERFYGASDARGFGPVSASTPRAAREFLAVLQRASTSPAPPGRASDGGATEATEEARTFPLGGAAR